MTTNRLVPWRVKIAEDAAAVGRDHEFHLLLRPFFFLTAGNDDEDCYVSPQIWATRSDAEAALAGLPPDFDPNAAGWEGVRPVYEADAWQDDGRWTLVAPDAAAA